VCLPVCSLPLGSFPLGPGRYGTLVLNDTLALFLFTWWAVGTGVLTIQGPFVDTVFKANAYFALWTGFGSSLLGIGLTLTRTQVIASECR